MKKIIKWVLIIIIILLIILGIVWWLKPKNQPSYITEPVKFSDISQTVSATGEISAAQLVDVGAQASGQIKRLYVKIGQEVKRGDLIAEIDSTSQVNALNETKAKLETFRARLVASQVALKSASVKYQREKNLWDQQATSKESLEDAENNLASARASVAELKSSIKQTQIAMNTAEADLGYTRIIAPMSGTVVSIVVEQGQTVNANQTTPTIVQIADLSNMLNKMQIAEGDINKVKPGMKINFTTLSQPDNHRDAVLDSVDPGLTTMSRGGYTKSTDTSDSAIYYYARAYVPNQDRSLYIGMTTENSIIVQSAHHVLSVPKLAVKQKNGQSYVRVLAGDNQIQTKNITTGLSDSMVIEIKSGLKEGEKVILSEVADNADDSDLHMRRPPM